MPRTQLGDEARAYQELESLLDDELHEVSMAVAASQPLGSEPSPSEAPTPTISPAYGLSRNTLPSLDLFQHGGLGFTSDDIGLGHANGLPPSLPSTDHLISRPRDSPDTVHTEVQSLAKTASTSDDGEQSKLDSADGPAKRRKTSKAAPSTVPLFCSACPHRPTFSDLSHLLTHLGSRGHTKFEFDARVKASTKTDPTAMKIIDEYDVWFKENNISKMLADRMNDKEKKRQAREEGEVAKRKRGPSQTTSSKKRKANDTDVKREVGEGAAFRQSPAGEQLGFHGHGFDFNGSPTNSSSFGLGSSSMSLQPMPYFEDDPAFEDARSPELCFLSDNESEPGNERMKLKGVFWPGMDMFDSATPENKRKRNQRKDSSVVTRMMRESSAIQPTLMVCDKNLTIERTRDIYESATEEEVMPKAPKAKKARTTASKPAVKPEAPVATSMAPQVRTMQRRPSADGQVQGPVEGRARRGSAALAITRIAEQAQNDFDVDFEDDFEEEDDLHGDLHGDLAPGPATRARPGRPSNMAQQWPVDLSRSNSTQSYRDGGSTTAGSDIFRDDEGNSGASQMSIEGQNESRSDIADCYMICSDMGITSQHQQNAQAMGAYGTAQNGMKPRSAWSTSMDSPNFLPLPMLSSFGDDMFSDSQGSGSHAAQSNSLQGQMDSGYGDAFQAQYFQPTSSRQNQSWNTINGSSGTCPSMDHSAFFSAGWMPNDQAFSFDQSEQQTLYDGDLGNMGNM
ncbi:hypothetical protein ACRALDRAFT_1067996 [Sodiomyces alcalophilus JCM 7366]|uniref:uncharacterized protein n=1 Tax=Sodiomyces alcalophilus JCM 7366 TaxID=591952 RepID=UPI0039B43FFF